MQTLSNSAIRSANRRLIAEIIFRNPNITQAQLMQQAGMSNHTLITIIRELEEAQIVQKGDPQASTGGRPPMSLKIRADSRYALGASTERGELMFCLSDFCGNIVDLHHYPISREADGRSIPESFFTEDLPRFAALVLEENRIPAGKVLGFAVNAKGWIDGDLWHCSGGVYSVPAIREACESGLGVPFHISRNDVNIAMSESWFLNEKDFLSLTLDEGIGGIPIRDGQADLGAHGRASTLAHMTLYPGGRQCTCGKRGCFDAYCAVHTLLEDGSASGPLGPLAEVLRAVPEERLDRYLEDLAAGIANLAVLADRPVIISGEMADWLEERWEELTMRVQKAAGEDFRVDIRRGQLGMYASVIAAAWHQLQVFFENEI